MKALAIEKGLKTEASCTKVQLGTLLAEHGAASTAQIRYLCVLGEQKGIPLTPSMLASKSTSGSQIEAWLMSSHGRCRVHG
eukprot:960494-Amphidinium_carterae.5